MGVFDNSPFGHDHHAKRFSIKSTGIKTGLKCIVLSNDLPTFGWFYHSQLYHTWILWVKLGRLFENSVDTSWTAHTCWRCSWWHGWKPGEKKKTDTQRRKTRRTDTRKKWLWIILNHWPFPGGDLQAASHVVFRRVFKYLTDFFPAISERIPVKAPGARQRAVCWALESKWWPRGKLSNEIHPFTVSSNSSWSVSMSVYRSSTSLFNKPICHIY